MTRWRKRRRLLPASRGCLSMPGRRNHSYAAPDAGVRSGSVAVQVHADRTGRNRGALTRHGRRMETASSIRPGFMVSNRSSTRGVGAHDVGATYQIDCRIVIPRSGLPTVNPSTTSQIRACGPFPRRGAPRSWFWNTSMQPPFTPMAKRWRLRATASCGLPLFTGDRRRSSGRVRLRPPCPQ